MNARTLGTLSLVLLAALIVGTIAYVKFHPSTAIRAASNAPVVAPLTVGSRAPNFTTDTTQGTFDLAALTKPALVEIFASWCPHCQRETAVLNALYARYGSRVAFVSIVGSTYAMDRAAPESDRDLAAFIARFQVRYPVAIYDPNLTIANRYLQGGYPTIVIVGRDKRIDYVDSGEVSEAVLARALDAALQRSARRR